MEKIYKLITGYHIDISRILSIGPIVNEYDNFNFEILFQLLDTPKVYKWGKKYVMTYRGSDDYINEVLEKTGFKKGEYDKLNEAQELLDKNEAQPFFEDYNQLILDWKNYSNAT